MRTIFSLLLFFILTSCGSAPARQVINEEVFNQQLLSACEKIRKDGLLVKVDVLRVQLQEILAGGRKNTSVPLPKPRTNKLASDEIADLVRPSTLSLALVYLCPKCEHLHFSNGATGYVIAPGVAATNRHVVESLVAESSSVKEGYLVAADAAGRVWSVDQVLACGTDADACLISIGASDLPALAFSDQARSGTPVYCMSHPQENHWRFTQGIIARYVMRTQNKKDKSEKLAHPVLVVDVTCEYSPGSSGAPIVDSYGNVVAMVESITPAGGVGEGNEKKVQVSSWLRECVAAEEVRALAR